jgi:hypothetical protein
MYALHPGRRDELMKLFECEFIESQEAVGIRVIGQFYDLDDPDQFVWLRGFNDMTARAKSLHAFYDGPVWKAHRDAANATMIDSDNVLLLRPVRLTSGFTLTNGGRPSGGSRSVRDGFLVATIYYFNRPVSSDFITCFENRMKPQLIQSGASILAYFVTEDSPNTFPQLPVREGEHVFVWFAGFPDQQAHRNHLAKLRESKLWNDEILSFLQEHIQGNPEVLRLTPTPRSWLTGKEK